jgi:hypothetical protein
MSEDEARKLCKTRATGTYIHNVRAALFALGVDSHLTFINQKYKDCLEWLPALSEHFPVFVSGEFHDRYNQKGRDRVRHHMIVIQNGLVFDPSERSPLPLDAYEIVFNKDLIIKAALIVDVENESYGRRKVS